MNFELSLSPNSPKNVTQCIFKLEIDNTGKFSIHLFQKMLLVRDLQSVTERKQGRLEIKAPFNGLKSKCIVYRGLYICILTCCELQTGK